MRKIIFALMVLTASATMAAAQGSYDIKEMTPQVQAAVDARKERFSELKTLKAQGMVGESNRGYVEVLGGGGPVKALVTAENRDRRAIYEAIIEQNGLGSGALATVEGVFAEVQRKKAAAGDKIQTEDGTWVTK